MKAEVLADPLAVVFLAKGLERGQDPGHDQPRDDGDKDGFDHGSNATGRCDTLSSNNRAQSSR